MKNNKKAAVVLAGCGAMDGAEISEAVLALYALSCNGVEYKGFAPNIEQYHVVNHAQGAVSEGESRNVMVEAARITRGDITPLEELNIEEFDMVIFAGGFGGAKNLSTFAFEGKDMSVEPSVRRAMEQAYESGKPIGAMCIMPVVVAAVLSGKGVVVSTGGDADTGNLLAANFGAVVENCPKDGITIDSKNRVVTTPAFMYGDNSLMEIGQGADKMVKALIDLA